MRSYEAACVFFAEESKFRAGKEAVSAVLNELQVKDLKEVDMGVRPLAYQIGKEIQAHYLVFQFQADPDKAHQIEDKVRYQQELMRILVTVHED